jgi:hypothetical protein
MHDRQQHRGFSITVTTRDDSTGGSNVTLLVEQVLARGTDIRGGAPVAEPEHYRSLLTGLAAVGEAMQRAKHAIDDALGERDPLDGE